MTPITRKEVEEAYWQRPITKPETIKEAVSFIYNSRVPNLTLVGWLLVGYEIARRRVLEGREL